MSKILYFSGESAPGGVLRATVPLVRLKELMKQESLRYVGDVIPDELKHGSTHATLIQIHVVEQEAGWRAGFYRSDKTPSEFERLLTGVE